VSRPTNARPSHHKPTENAEDGEDGRGDDGEGIVVRHANFVPSGDAPRGHGRVVAEDVHAVAALGGHDVLIARRSRTRVESI
jgi:hypothetical protein